MDNRSVLSIVSLFKCTWTTISRHFIVWCQWIFLFCQFNIHMDVDAEPFSWVSLLIKGFSKLVDGLPSYKKNIIENLRMIFCGKGWEISGRYNHNESRLSFNHGDYLHNFRKKCSFLIGLYYTWSSAISRELWIYFSLCFLRIWNSDK